MDPNTAPGHIPGQPNARNVGIGGAGQVAACIRIDTRKRGLEGTSTAAVAVDLRLGLSSPPFWILHFMAIAHPYNGA